MIDQPLMFNRFGAQNVNGTIYALRRDVVDSSGRTEEAGGSLSPGSVSLRSDKRPRPLVLRMAKGDCLQVEFQNLLDPQANPNNHPIPVMRSDDQVADRHASFSPIGLELVNSITDAGSFVGENESAVVPPGGRATYTFYGQQEGAHLVLSDGAPFGGEATGGNNSNGLFGVVTVQPPGARFYRSQVTEEDMRLATDRHTDTGHPVIDYEAVYPNEEPWISEGVAGLPILNMLRGTELVHSDLTAVIAGPNEDGSFPEGAYAFESTGKRNPAIPNRLEAFREFTVVFHDEVVAAQAFPGWFEDPVLKYTLGGVRDSFMINYGSGGIGSEVIANRLKVGPSHDCLNCAYEEFFLSAFAVGDPAMVVDVPANAGLEHCMPDGTGCTDPAALGPKATAAFYPDDPANVTHSYLSDFVKFRNLHAGPKEHHIFHLHNHQWLYNPDDDNSNYVDAQAVGPGSAYTYEIAFGGSGNRNKSAGDAIYHCHFYPHFAQGMWQMWRVHDTFEAGTKLAASAWDYHDEPHGLSDGTPAPGARALPDGEIVAGTPIPALVPLPGKPLAPIPGTVTVAAVDKDNDGTPESSQAVLSAIETDPLLVDTRPVAPVPPGETVHVDNQLNPTGLKNPGYPFWIAGIDAIVGQRPSTPPLDMLASAGGWDGGLPRHVLDGYRAGGHSVDTQNRLDFSKVIEVAKAHFLPETGTPVERAAMAFHARPQHPTFKLSMNVSAEPASFETNGQLPRPGAPFYDPCRDDNGNLLKAGVTASFFGGTGGGVRGNGWLRETPTFGADNPRVYKAANIQTDVVFNKLGYHFPQQRILTLWHDVLPTLNKTRPPEPFVMRANSMDCMQYLQTNLIPAYYELDDYQVRTPTDVIGQHIHLPKWDLVSADGSGNGWNYEDGVLAAEAVRERIHAINAWNDEHAPGTEHLHEKPHYFAAFQRPEWLGARVNIQRWFVDPLFNSDGYDRGLGITFTHDHFGPSTHQQVGLYATLLVEPKRSAWVHNETGVPLYTRDDGGPTTWQAVIKPGDTSGDGVFDDFREFYIEFADFQHAYEANAWVGVNAAGLPAPPDENSFRKAVNPAHRAQATFPNIVKWEPSCPGGQPRPCPEAISADDVGMYVVNYRNEPIAARVFDPNALGPDGKRGTQAAGLAGDMAYAFQTRTDRKIPALNTINGAAPYPALTAGLQNGDPFTPVLRAVDGDLIRIRAQTGAHEEDHHSSIHGMKWLKESDSFGGSNGSGWKAGDFVALSEKMNIATSLNRDLTQAGTRADYMYSFTSEQRGLWSGDWGVIRTYEGNQANLTKLSYNNRTRRAVVTNRAEFSGVCPLVAPVRTYDVTAVSINAVMTRPAGVTIRPADASDTMHVGARVNPNGGTLVYNERATPLENGRAGPLHDPTALIYVPTDDLVPNPTTGAESLACNALDTVTGQKLGVRNMSCPAKLPAGYEPKPLTLRAAAGDCIDVTLRNRLPAKPVDLAGWASAPWIVKRDAGQAGQSAEAFDLNLVRPSGHIGLHAQLVEYDVTRSDGTNVGINPVQTVAPNGTRVYRWYAGDHQVRQRQQNPNAGVDARTRVTIEATPVEYGAINLMPADKIKQGQKGLIGNLVILPEGSTWTEDGGDSLSATVTTAAGDVFRDHVAMFHKSVNLRYGDATAVEILSDPEGVSPEIKGNVALNYRTEPMWFRFGLPAGAPHFPGDGAGTALAELNNAHMAFSNALVGGDPQTPVWTSPAGMETRFRLTQPWAGGRSIVFGMQGHGFQRNPYLSDTVPSQHIGHNPKGLYANTIEGFGVGGHHNVVVEAGGSNNVEGDYLVRDYSSEGMTDGLWGVFRVEGPDEVAGAN